MDHGDEACQYDAMNHGPSNDQFIEDLLATGARVRDVLDVGTGTARIPIALCRRIESCRIMAADLSCAMLDLARYHIEVNGMIGRIQLDRCDAKRMHYRDGMFDVVMCNGTLHHFADPAPVLAEAWRVTSAEGHVFFRDLVRPPDEATLAQWVDAFAGEANERQQQLFRDSLRAALSVEEIRAALRDVGVDPQTVQPTGTRHWTWSTQK